LAERLQQTPLAVTADPPVAVTLPPLVTEVSPIFVVVAVVTTGEDESDVNETSAP
jgi:hypothetical protein